MDAGNRSQCGLPDWHELSAAIRYVAGDRPGDHLVTRWARALAHLHRTRHIDPGRASDIDQRRAEVVTLINQWVSTHLSPATRAADFGPAADALAAAWSQVGYLATQWADLVTAVVDGQPCPPGRC